MCTSLFSGARVDFPMMTVAATTANAAIRMSIPISGHAAPFSPLTASPIMTSSTVLIYPDSPIGRGVAKDIGVPDVATRASSGLCVDVPSTGCHPIDDRTWLWQFSFLPRYICCTVPICGPKRLGRIQIWFLADMFCCLADLRHEVLGHVE